MTAPALKPGTPEAEQHVDDFILRLRDVTDARQHFAAHNNAAQSGRDNGERREGVLAFPVVRFLEGTAPPPPIVQVQDWMLDLDVNLWAGNGAAGKGVLMSATAIAVVLGRRLFGTLAVKRPGPVVMSVPEDGRTTARMVNDALINGLGLSATDRKVLAEGLVMIPDEITVNITKDTQRLGQTALEQEAVAVLIDPLSNHLAGASEREEEIATLVCDSLRRNVCRYANVSVGLTHHLRKPGKDGSDVPATVADIRGSGGWVNSSRLAFSVSKKPGHGRITVCGLKSNRIRADIRHELDLEIEADADNAALWRSCSITDVNIGASSESLTPGIGRSLNANEQTALSCLDDRHEPGKRVSWSGWVKQSGLNENTFKSIKDRLLSAGIAAAIPTGKKTRNGSPEYAYEITAEGRQAHTTGWISERSKGEG